MSNPARFPDRSHSRFRSSGGDPGSLTCPASVRQWESWGAALSGSASIDGHIHHTTPLYQAANRKATADIWGGHAAHSAPWAGTPDQNLGNNMLAINRGPTSAYRPEVDVNGDFPPLENWSQRMNHRHKRLKWREEILSGDPEKAIKNGHAQALRLVITFISRGSPKSPHGQGLEIMRFRPPKASHSSKADDWTYFAMDASLLHKNKKGDVITSAVQLSKRPLAFLLPKLDVKKDLKLVRKSKPLLWDDSTVLESFLYRIVEKKEDPESAGGKDLAQRLGGPSLHGWYQTSETQSLLMSTNSDLICTALNAVFFPPRLSAAIDSYLGDKESCPEQLALRALETLYLCVQLQHARLAFKFYPVPPPPSGQPENVLCEKRRVWAYWTEVLAWHLSKLREDAQASTSYILLKSLSAVKDSVDDPKVTLDELEKIMVNEIAIEANRSRYANDTLIDEATWECLHNSSLSLSQKSSGKMHIITSGDCPIVFGVIAKLITHVLEGSVSLTERSLRSTMDEEMLDLKITIAESRPLSKGVVLATKLARFVDSHMEYRARASKDEKCDAAVSSTRFRNLLLNHDTPSHLIKGTFERDHTHSPTSLHPPTLGLSHLLANLDAKKDKKEPKVTIEVITDAAVVRTTIDSHDSGIKPIILLSADCILSNGNSINRVGTAQMAWAGKSSGGVVLILCRAGRLHPKGLAAPPKPKTPVDQLKKGWKSTIPEQVLRGLQNSSHVKINNPTHENIDHKHVTSYITELGIMPNYKLKEFLNKRNEIQKAVWPVNDLTK